MADKNSAPVIFCPHLSKCKWYTELSSELQRLQFFSWYQLYCLVMGQVVCELLAQSCFITATHCESNPQLDVSYKDTVSVWINRPFKTKLAAAGPDLRRGTCYYQLSSSATSS